MFKRVVLFLFSLYSTVSIYAQPQTGIVNGTVKDDKDNTLPGVLITIQESTTTSITNENGEFTIEASAGNKLTFSLNGYETSSTTIISDGSSVEITLKGLLFGDTEQDLVPVAYSEKKKRYITGAISTSTFNEFSKSKDMNVMNGLGGLINGLIVQANPWSEGGGDPAFYIRGLKTTNPNNAPLILVDDVERNFGQLNYNEIASITVLKDAAALAIYGMRGANGVILVRTKRGTANKRDIMVHSEIGMAQSLRLPEFLNAYDYARLYNKAQQLDGVAEENLKYSDEDLQGYKAVVEGTPGANPHVYPNVDFYSEFLKPLMKQQQHDLTMTGGNDVAQYFVLLGYMNREGIYKYGDNTFERYNFRTNMDVNLTKHFVVSLDMAGRLESQTTPGANYAYAIFGQFASTPSNSYPIFNEDGSLGGTNDFKNNPYGIMNRLGERDEFTRYFNSDMGMKLDLSKLVSGLSWNAHGGIDFIDGFTQQLTAGQFAVYQLLDNGDYDNLNTKDEVKSKNFWFNYKTRQISFHTSLNYDRSWGYNRLNAMTLFYLREKKEQGLAIPYKTVGNAVQLNYSYMDKYLIDGVASYTGSENFASGHRFGLFPSLSLGWIISEENFLKENNTISFLKVRASYGKTGLDRPINDRFLFREVWGTAGGYGFGPSGSYANGIDQVRAGNNSLKWETSIKSNIGMDIGFFDNMLLWTIDGFVDNRNDIIIQKYATNPQIAGLPLPYENGGKARGWGFDSELAYKKQLSPSWKMMVKANVVLARNKIIDIDETVKADAYQYQKGNPIGQPFGYVSDGFFTEEELAGYNILQNGGNIRAGDIKYKDLNNDSVIDGRDTRPIGGSGVPTIFGGLSVFLQYKMIDFSAQMMGMGKRYVYMPYVYNNNFNGGGNATVYALEAWTPETAETAIYPRLSENNNSNNLQYSDFWFRNGAFLKLKTVEVGFNFPQNLLKKVGVAKIRLYANGFNLLCFDHVKDFDPESTGAGLWSYPFNRIVTLGLNITF